MKDSKIKGIPITEEVINLFVPGGIVRIGSEDNPNPVIVELTKHLIQMKIIPTGDHNQTIRFDDLPEFHSFYSPPRPIESEYYKDQIDKIDFQNEFKALVKFRDVHRNSTKWLNVTKESAKIIVEKLIKEFNIKL